jgi:AcrR family transcriptional regulator/ribosomal protein L37AE/L43A
VTGTDNTATARKRTASRRSDFDDRCLDWLWRALYSADGRRATCPRCGRQRAFHRVRARLSYSCDTCGWHIHPTAGTLFHRSHVPLGAWFRAVAIVTAQPASTGSTRLHKELDVGPRTAARMTKLIRVTLAGLPPSLADRLPADAQRELLVLIAQSAAPTGDALEPLSLPKPLAPAASTTANGRLRELTAQTDPRERILEAASRAIVKRGMGATRIADIAREAGVSPAIVHYYFATKDAVLLEAARWVERETVAQRDRIVYGAGPALTKLSRFVDAQRVSHERSWQEIIVYFGLWDRAIRSPRYRADSTRARQQWKAYWVAMLQQGVEEGVLTLAAPLDDVIERIAAFLDGISIQILLGHPWLDEERAARLTYDFVAEQVGVSAAELRDAGTAAVDDAAPVSTPRRRGRKSTGHS